MSQAYLGRSARSLNQSVYSGYSTGTAASQGRIVRRSPAPRFHPFIIILAVIFIGMVIVGLVMTIIANWPGYSSIGFNALEIVGPVILGVGGLALICTIVVVVMRNNYQKEEWERKMIDAERSRAIYASRLTMEHTTPNASIGRPSKSILKKTPSTSTYGRDSNVFEEGSDSGVAAYTPNHVNNSYEPESDLSDAQKPHSVYKIETMPDPTAARQGRNNSNYQPQQPYREQHSTDSESHVPVPIRVPKSKKSRSQPSQPQYAQESYATQEPPLARGSPLVGTPDIGGMSDRLSYTSDQEIVATPTTPTSYHAPAPKPHRTMQNYEHQRSYDAFDPNSGHSQTNFQPPPMGYEQPAGPASQADAAPQHKPHSRSRDETEPLPEDLDRNNEVRRSRRKKKKKPAMAAEGIQDGTPDVEYAKPRKHKKRTQQPTTSVPAVPGQQSSPTLTRINIHAHPGTSVSITPGGPQYQTAPQHNVSKGSVETEI